MAVNQLSELFRSILYLDHQADEGEVFATLVSPYANVHTTSSMNEAKRHLQNSHITVVVTTHNPAESAVQDLIELTSARNNHSARWILTGYVNYEEGWTTAKIHKMHHYIQRPWQANEVRNVIEAAFELAAMQDQNAQLNKSYHKELAESKQHEAALEKSEERMKLALQTAKFGIWDWDVCRNELTWDPSMFEIFGVNQDEFKGAYEAWENTVYPEDLDPANAEVQKALKGEKPFDTEFRILRFGEIAYIRAIGKVYWDEKGNPTRMLGVNYDITNERTAEAKLLNWNENLERIVNQRTLDLQRARDEAEQANKTKSVFLSRMSHELRTPLNSIIGFSQLLLLDQSNLKHSRNAERINKAGKHLLNLINDVLDISKIESGQTSFEMTSVDVLALIQEVCEMMSDTAHDQGIALKQPTAQTPLFAQADYNRLRQVLLNLVSNGIKYNRPQGDLNLDVQEIAEEKKIHIHVCDTGPGIPKNMMHRLFTPFDRLDIEQTTASIEGTGLGLALCKNLVQGMNGTIKISQTSPKGSIFSVTLNRANPQ